MFSLSKTTSAFGLVLTLSSSLGAMAAEDVTQDLTTSTLEQERPAVPIMDSYKANPTAMERLSWERFDRRLNRWQEYWDSKEQERLDLERERAGMTGFVDYVVSDTTEREEILEGMPMDKIQEYLLGKRKTINTDFKYAIQETQSDPFSGDQDYWLATAKVEVYQSELSKLEALPRVGFVWDNLRRELAGRFTPFQVLLAYRGSLDRFAGKTPQEKFWSFAWKQLLSEGEYFKSLEEQQADAGWQALYQELGRIIAITKHQLTEKELDRFLALESRILAQTLPASAKAERKLKAAEHLSKVVNYALRSTNRSMDKHQIRNACRFSLMSMAPVAQK